MEEIQPCTDRKFVVLSVLCLKKQKQEKLEGTKGVIRRYKVKKDRQYNGKKEKQ